MHPLERLTLDTIRQDALLRPDDAVLVVGVSAGPDSVALLHVLAGLQPELGNSLVAVYVDHGLRPRESKVEAGHVQALARQLGTGCEIVSVAVREHARATKLSLEHAARDLRYQALREAAAGCGASTVAVAHTADDQAEEILIRLLRGGGRMALSGMRTRRDDLIRPFLHIEKARILEYLREKEIRYYDDSMNADMRYLRSRVRHQLLPYLEEHFDKGVRRALRKTADCLAEDESLLADLTDQALAEVVVPSAADPQAAPPRIELRRAVLVGKPRALQRRIIEKVLWRIGGSASYPHILKIIDAARNGRTGSELHLGGGLRLGVQREYLELLFPRGKGPWRGRLYPAEQTESNR
jgi:tRNA(Ile)-lysidine synthase